jgi:hypothetical protein
VGLRIVLLGVTETKFGDKVGFMVTVNSFGDNSVSSGNEVVILDCGMVCVGPPTPDALQLISDKKSPDRRSNLAALIIL